MAIMFYLFLALFVVAMAATALLRTTPARLAAIIRYSAPAALAAVGIVFALTGRFGAGLGILGLAGAIFARVRQSAAAKPSPGRRSHVRSAVLEMMLDLDTGEMNGLVLAGHFEGQELNALGEEDLLLLYDEMASDAESCQLMEAYLDRRMPGWRDDADANGDGGLGTPPGAGAMTKEEAYQILGLGSGAGETEIREAHRRLMKRVHPDTGGSDFLAARINEAKDLLLRRHH